MAWINIDKERFKRMFPNLAKELEESEKTYTLRIERDDKDPWRGYEPDVIDFIRRAETVEDALKVIEYLEKRGELSKGRADSLRKQLLEKGLSSFGPRKKPGYYLSTYYYDD